jgi:hypothetical protein
MYYIIELPDIMIWCLTNSPLQLFSYLQYKVPGLVPVKTVIHHSGGYLVSSLCIERRHAGIHAGATLPGYVHVAAVNGYSVTAFATTSSS